MPNRHFRWRSTQCLRRHSFGERKRHAKLEKITFELARLKAWKFGAHTERLNAEQRQMFETTAAEDEADLAAQLAALQGHDTSANGTPSSGPRAHLGRHVTFASLLSA
jgi:hypothetical protein